MRLPAITNATLTEVRAGGGSEDYDTPGSPGAVKWSGEQAVYVNDETVSEDVGERTSLVVERSVVVDDGLSVDWARGDTLAYTYRNDQQAGTVKDVKVTSAPGLPGVVRLMLEAT